MNSRLSILKLFRIEINEELKYKKNIHGSKFPMPKTKIPIY